MVQSCTATPSLIILLPHPTAAYKCVCMRYFCLIIPIIPVRQRVHDQSQQTGFNEWKPELMLLQKAVSVLKEGQAMEFTEPYLL